MVKPKLHKKYYMVFDKQKGQKMTKRDIPLAGVVQDQDELNAILRVYNTKPIWHVSGPECSALQNELADYYGVRYCVVVNSGSSANLLAMKVLGLTPKSLVLTSACGFPATLSPIIHCGLHPFLVDYDIQTLNADLNQVEKALKYNKSIGAMIFAHTLGSPLDMGYLLHLREKYNIPLIEDCCEAIGTHYKNKPVGSFGDMGTISFYSSHQISGFGGGGAVLTSNKEYYENIKSMRDWGKNATFEGSQTTKMSQTVDGIPYDQQYTYETIGYNMRLPDVNCAYTREQLKKLDYFIIKRQRNYLLLKERVKDCPLHLMKIPDGGEPAYFGFPIVLSKPGLRDNMVKYLEANGIHVRLFFAGNILRHSPFKKIIYATLCDGFPVADYLMENGLFCGVWPGLSIVDMEYVGQKINDFFKETN